MLLNAIFWLRTSPVSYLRQQLQLPICTIFLDSGVDAEINKLCGDLHRKTRKHFAIEIQVVVYRVRRLITSLDGQDPMCQARYKCGAY
jgi:hypothetical protein